jgi:hypothetical protein
MGADREAEAQRRRERLAEALRENLKRRKAQQHGRAAPAPPPQAEGRPDGSH